MSSMSDLVFLLLIFFVITSTLVSPNMIPVNLPSSDAGKQSKNSSLAVYLDSAKVYHVALGEVQSPATASLDTLGSQLRVAMEQAAAEQGESEQLAVILRADQDVPVQCMVDMMSVVSALNKEREGQQKQKFNIAVATKNP